MAREKEETQILRQSLDPPVVKSLNHIEALDIRTRRKIVFFWPPRAAAERGRASLPAQSGTGARKRTLSMGSRAKCDGQAW